MSDQVTETTTEKDFSLMSAADEIISNEPSQADAPEKASTEGDNPAKEPQQTTEEAKATTTEDILNKVELDKENPKANEEILNLINSLGAIHNGQPVKVDSVDQLKELVQKGYDYTKKTMEISEKDKAFTEKEQKYEAEYKQRQTQLQEYENSLATVIQETQIAEAVLADMKATDPDLFEDFRQRYEKELNRRNQFMPYLKQFEGQVNQLNGKLQSLEQQKAQSELAAVRQNWESELKDTQTNYAPKLAKLGIVVDWDKVQKTWQADASGKLSVVGAVGALYGDAIQNAYESQQKMLETKNKTANAILKRTGAGANPGKGDDVKKLADKHKNDPNGLNKFLLASF